MAARATPKNILGKSVTKKELIDVLYLFEQSIDRKIWSVLPWYKKLWRYFRGPYRAQRRQNRLAQKAAQGRAVRERKAGGGSNVVQKGAA